MAYYETESRDHFKPADRQTTAAWEKLWLDYWLPRKAEGATWHDTRHEFAVQHGLAYIHVNAPGRIGRAGTKIHSFSVTGYELPDGTMLWPSAISYCGSQRAMPGGYSGLRLLSGDHSATCKKCCR